MAYSAKVAGSNCIGPSAPAPLAPDHTPGAVDRPFPLSTVPMAASTDQDSPGHRPAACWYNVTQAVGTAAPSGSPPTVPPTVDAAADPGPVPADPVATTTTPTRATIRITAPPATIADTLPIANSQFQTTEDSVSGTAQRGARPGS